MYGRYCGKTLEIWQILGLVWSILSIMGCFFETKLWFSEKNVKNRENCGRWGKMWKMGKAVGTGGICESRGNLWKIAKFGVLG
jgi:hypothetical protein